jgi:hypothetical protein
VTDVDAPDAPFQLADMAPRPRRRWLLPLLVALGAVVLTGGVVAFVATRSGEPPAPPAAAAATSAALLSENDACVKLNPLLRRSSDMYAAYVKDMTTPSTDEASALRAELREVQKVAPADMSPDIGQVMKGVILLPGGGAGINFEDWQNAGVSLAKRCFGAI